MTMNLRLLLVILIPLSSKLFDYGVDTIFFWMISRPYWTPQIPSIVECPMDGESDIAIVDLSRKPDAPCIPSVSLEDRALVHNHWFALDARPPFASHMGPTPQVSTQIWET